MFQCHYRITLNRIGFANSLINRDYMRVGEDNIIIFRDLFKKESISRESVNVIENNLADAAYFSRRINMYPGPGILPGEGRTLYVTLGLKI